MDSILECVVPTARGFLLQCPLGHAEARVPLRLLGKGTGGKIPSAHALIVRLSDVVLRYLD
jgi:hypothetical protein